MELQFHNQTLNTISAQLRDDSRPHRRTRLTQARSRQAGSYTSISSREEGPRVQKNKGGRPRTRQPPTYPPSKQYAGKTKLRCDRPVLSELPVEIWQWVFTFCPPDFLLKARSVNLTFYRILSEQGSSSLWKLARHRHFGSSQPDPPPSLSERQYADLLAGLGCQSCQDGKARRTYWAFQRRWCESCLENNIERERLGLSLASYITEEAVLPNEFSGLWKHISGVFSRWHISDLVPSARFDSWGHYQWAGSYEEGHPKWGKIYPTGQHVLIQRKARYGLLTEIKEFLEKSLQHGNPEWRIEDHGTIQHIIKESENWLQIKFECNLSLMEKLQEVESWCERSRMAKWDKLAAIKSRRVEYFESKASAMSPPISQEVLQQCPAYQRASIIPKSPTERSWKVLQEKLIKERGLIEEKIKLREREEQSKDVQSYRRQLIANFEINLKKTENLESSPEHRFILALADVVIAEVMASGSEVSRKDFLHVILRRVFDKYQSLDNKPFWGLGQYRLLLNDVRIICRAKIYPILEENDDCDRSSTSQAVKMLKCPWCPDSSSPARNSLMFFDDLISHIGKDHLRNDALGFLRIEENSLSNSHPMFPFLCLEWPANLPILAPHHKSTGQWDPDDWGARRLPTFDLSISGGTSRRIRNAPLPREFVQSLCYCAFRLEKARKTLNASTRASFAVEWARTRYEFWSKGRNVEATLMEDMCLALEICSSVKELFDQLRCALCRSAQANHIKSTSRAFEELKDHYLHEHRYKAHTWARDMFNFNEYASRVALALQHQEISATDVSIIRDLFPNI